MRELLLKAAASLLVTVVTSLVVEVLLRPVTRRSRRLSHSFASGASCRLQGCNVDGADRVVAGAHCNCSTNGMLYGSSQVKHCLH